MGNEVINTRALQGRFPSSHDNMAQPKANRGQYHVSSQQQQCRRQIWDQKATEQPSNRPSLKNTHWRDGSSKMHSGKSSNVETGTVDFPMQGNDPKVMQGQLQKHKKGDDSSNNQLV